MSNRVLSRIAHRLAIAICLLLPVHAGSQLAQAKDNWISVRSQNFFLVGNASEKDIRKVANRLEQFRKVFTLLFPKMNFSTTVPTTVIVFKSDSSYKPFKPGPNMAGYFQAGDDVNYITLTTEHAPNNNPFRIIFHEYVHLLIHNTLGRSVPVWFNEGLAEYYSTFDILDDNQKVILGNLIDNHVLYLRQNKLLPLTTLFAVDYRSPYYNEGNKMNIFYAESWMLLHYLMQGNNQQLRPQLARFVNLLAANVAVADAFKQAFQMSFEAFEKDFRSYVQNQKYTATAVTFKEKLEFDSEMQTVPVAEAEAQGYLGDLLLHTNRLNEAEARLQQSLALDPSQAMAQASLGMLRVRQGRFDEAKQYLQKAVAANSRNYLAHYYYAFALSRERMNEYQMISSYSSEAAETMRAELGKAIELKPDFPESYTLLAMVNLVRDEETDESIALLKRALSLSRANQRVTFMLAQLYLRKQDFSGARQLLEPIAHGSSDRQMRDHAQTLLDQLAHTEAQLARLKSTGNEEALTSGEESSRPRLRPRGEAATPAAKEEEEAAPAPLDPMAYLSEALRKPREGELRVQGMLVGIDCNAKGIFFLVGVGERLLKLHTDGFERMDIRTFTRDVAGEITCGPRKPENPVVVTYLPANAGRKVDGEATALEFVPKDFQLKQ